MHERISLVNTANHVMRVCHLDNDNTLIPAQYRLATAKALVVQFSTELKPWRGSDEEAFQSPPNIAANSHLPCHSHH